MSAHNLTLVSTVVYTQMPHDICQSELAHVLELRRQRDAVDERINEAEQAIRTALENGASVQGGILTARLKVTERRSVAWKSVCERELGDDYCRRVLAATHPDQFTTLVVSARVVETVAWPLSRAAVRSQFFHRLASADEKGRCSQLLFLSFKNSANAPNLKRENNHAKHEIT